MAFRGTQSFISYAYGYTGTGLQAMNPVFEISTAYPALSTYFGLLTGFAFSIPFAFAGIVWGGVVNKVNRKTMLGLVMLATGLCCGASGFGPTLGYLIGARLLSGVLLAACNPLSFSLLAEYFPPEKRTTANSIL